MNYLVIGLGIYGENLARDLTNMGNDVIGVDNEQSKVDAIKDAISTVYKLDSTEQSALEALPLRNIDLAIVAIGENFGASIKTVALLKQAGVKHIYARAIDKLHEAILQSFEIDAILTPEQRAAADLADELQLGSTIRTLNVGDNSDVVLLAPPESIIGEKYSSLNLRERYGIELIAATRPRIHSNLLGIEHTMPGLLDLGEDSDLRVGPTDTLTIFGPRKKIREFYSHK